MCQALGRAVRGPMNGPSPPEACSNQEDGKSVTLGGGDNSRKRRIVNDGATERKHRQAMQQGLVPEAMAPERGRSSGSMFQSRPESDISRIEQGTEHLRHGER